MGNSLKKTIHIEFYGLPGSGKSTISHLLAKKLEDNNYKIKEPSYDIDHNYKPFFRKMKKILISLFFIIAYPYKAFCLFKLIKLNEYSGLSIIRHFLNISPKLYIYLNNKFDYIIWDEGLVQSSISLSFNNSSIDVNHNISKLFEIVDFEINNAKFIYLLVDTDVALERMNNREDNYSRIEKEKNYIKAKEMIFSFQLHCNDIKILQYNKVCSLKSDIEQITEQILDIL